MHDEVKKSLNKVLEQQLKTTNGPLHGRKRTRKFMPIVMSFAVVLMIGIGTIYLVRDNITISNTATSNDKMTLDHLKREYVGNNSAISEITNTILYPYEIERIELQTKQQPYSVIIYTPDEISEFVKYKYAIYLFSLIQNAEIVEFYTGTGLYTLDKKSFEQAFELDFSLVEGDEMILKTLYEIYATELPKLQTSREDAYKYAFNAVNSNSYQSDFDTIEQPDVAFTLDGKTYIAWFDEEKQQAILVHTDNADGAILVEGSDYTDLENFTNSGFELVKGTISSIEDNQLSINTGDEAVVSYLVAVDNGSDYEVGDIVTVWTTMATRSIPAQATATKILKHR